MKWIETVPPASEPITYAQAKAQLRLDDDLDQLYITGLIVACRKYCERYLNRSLVTRTIAVTHYGMENNSFGYAYGNKPFSNWLSLPRGPVQTITSVTDGNGNTVDSSNYELRRIGNVDYCFFITVPFFGFTGVTITYQAGYGTPAQVDADIIAGLLMHVAHLWFTREAVVDGQQTAVAHGLEAIYGLAGSGEIGV